MGGLTLLRGVEKSIGKLERRLLMHLLSVVAVNPIDEAANALPDRRLGAEPDRARDRTRPHRFPERRPAASGTTPGWPAYRRPSRSAVPRRSPRLANCCRHCRHAR